MSLDSESGSLQRRAAATPEPLWSLADDLSPLHSGEDDVFDLREYLGILRRRMAIALSLGGAVLLAVLVFTFAQRKLYKATVSVDVEQASQDMLNFKGISLNVQPDIEQYLETQYNILQSQTLAEQVIHDLRLTELREFRGDARDEAEARRNALGAFQQGLSIDPVEKSNIVKVSFLSQDPNLSAKVANTLVRDYIQQSIDVRFRSTSQAAEFLTKQLAGMKQQLEQSEDQLQRYSAANGIVFLNDQDKQNVTTARLQQLQNDYTQAQADRYHWQSMDGLLRDGQAPPDTLTNQGVQQLDLQLANLQRQYRDVTTIYKPEHPAALRLHRQIVALQQALASEKSSLASDIRKHYQAAQQREALLQGALDRQKAEVNDIAQRSVEYNILQRQVDSNRTLYDGLLQRLKTAEINSGLNASSIHVVDPAVAPLRPAKPILWLNCLLGLLGGLFVGISAAFFQEYLDNSLKTPDDVVRHLGLTVLGLIPAIEEAPVAARNALPGARHPSASAGPVGTLADGLPGLQAHSPAGEAYRALRTTLLLGANVGSRVYLVSSAIPGEGKTTTAVNLAASLAGLGRRVVIIDADLRKPQIHRRLDVRFHPGLADYLSGVAQVGDIIHETEIEGLSVIPFGHLPPNPVDLLMGGAVVELMDGLRERFDYVFFDTPPVLYFADARVLAPVVDAALLVVRAGETPRENVVRARRLFEQVNGRILGIVLNGLAPNTQGYEYYGYKYYSSYRHTDDDPGVGDSASRAAQEEEAEAVLQHRARSASGD